MDVDAKTDQQVSGHEPEQGQNQPDSPPKMTEPTTPTTPTTNDEPSDSQGGRQGPVPYARFVEKVNEVKQLKAQLATYQGEVQQKLLALEAEMRTAHMKAAGIDSECYDIVDRLYRDEPEDKRGKFEVWLGEAMEKRPLFKRFTAAPVPQPDAATQLGLNTMANTQQPRGAPITADMLAGLTPEQYRELKKKRGDVLSMLTRGIS